MKIGNWIKHEEKHIYIHKSGKVISEFLVEEFPVHPFGWEPLLYEQRLRELETFYNL